MENYKKFFLDKLSGSSINLPARKTRSAVSVNDLRRWQWDSFKKNRQRQAAKLFETLDYSIKNIPYYKKISEKTGFFCSEKTIFEDIKKWPVLTKDDIRENFQDLCNQKYVAESALNCSGGTTGEPVKIYQQGANVDLLDNLTWLQFEWAGLVKGNMLIQLWGNEEELFEYGDNASGIIKISDSHYILNSFRMSDVSMERYRLFINEKKPKMILAYIQSVYELAKFIKKNGLQIYSPAAIMTSAGTLHESHKKYIEDVFGCPAYNKYGSREVHSLACSCEKDEGLHADIFFHFIEILDENQQPIEEEGRMGEIFVTLFDNPVMPLIRYRIGDIATFTKKICSCGRGIPLIKKINGRTVDVFVNEKGEKIDGEYFTHLFYLKDFIRQFQIVQKKIDEIKIIVVPNEKNILDVHKEDFLEIKGKMKLVMGEKCRIEVEEISQIELPKSGKLRYTISEIEKI